MIVFRCWCHKYLPNIPVCMEHICLMPLRLLHCKNYQLRDYPLQFALQSLFCPHSKLIQFCLTKHHTPLTCTCTIAMLLLSATFTNLTLQQSFLYLFAMADIVPLVGVSDTFSPQMI